MEKLCLVKPKRLVTGLGKPFDSEKTMRLTGRGMELCMACGTVEEILNDGTTQVLNRENYNEPHEKTIVDIDAYLNETDTTLVDSEEGVTEGNTEGTSDAGSNPTEEDDEPVMG